MPTCLEILTKKQLSPKLFDRTDDISLNMPIDQHVAWIFDAIYSKSYPTELQSAVIARKIHGIQHVTRVAIYIPIFANLYKRFGDEDPLRLNDEEIKLLQIAALFHDAGREAEGKDYWDQDSGLLFYYYAIKILHIDPIKATLLAEAIANKDAHPDHYYELIKDTWVKRAEPAPINIYQKLIHDSDCLDIIRARDCFDASYLDFYYDIATKHTLSFALMAKLITEARSLIASQGDAYLRLHIPTKCLYNNGQAYRLIMTFIEKHQALYPLMLALLNDQPFIEGTHYQPLCFTTDKDKETSVVSAESLTLAMYNGELLARGVGSPAGFNEGQNQCIAAREIYKNSRRPGIPTRTKKANNLEKDGNPNRSVTMLGFGALPYIAQGFLLKRRLQDISHIYFGNGATGRGKKTTVQDPILRDQEKSKKLNALHIRLQMGGLPMHNEIICTIKDVIAIYYSCDPTYYNIRMYGKAEPLNEYTHYLQALFLQLEHKKATGIVLPIFEYSAVHNYIKAAPNYTDEEIVAMWVKIVSELMQDDIESGPGFCQPLETLKIKAIDGCMDKTSLNIKHAALDVNYSPALREKINAVLKAKATKRTLEYYQRLAQAFQDIKDGDQLIALLKDPSKKINCFKVEQILPVIKDRLGDLIKTEEHLFKLFYQPLERLNSSQIDIILTEIEGQLDTVITNIIPLITIFRLPLDRCNTTQRMRMLSGIQGQLKTLIKEGYQLVFLLDLPLVHFPYLLRVKLLDDLDNQLKNLITNEFLLHELFELPLDKLNDRHRRQIWNALEDRLDIIITTGKELCRLLALPLDKLNLLQRIKIWKAVEGRLDTLITESTDLFSLLALPVENLNPLQRYLILEKLENRFQSLIKNGEDLYNLLALPAAKLNPLHYPKIWKAVEELLEMLITKQYLYTLHIYTLDDKQIELLCYLIERQLEFFIEDWAILNALFALPLNKLTTPNRLKIWAAIEPKLGTLNMQAHQLYPLMQLSLEQLNPQQRDQILATVQDRLGDFIKDAKGLLSFLTLNTLNFSQRNVILGSLEAHLDTIFKNEEELFFFLQLPITHLDIPQRIKILNRLNNRLGTLINHGYLLCCLLKLPLEKFSAVQRQNMLAAIDDKLGTLVNEQQILLYLLGLSLEQFTYLQRVRLFKALEYHWNTLITKGFQLYHLFDLPLNKLNYPQRQQIWRAMEAHLGSIITRGEDLHNLLELPVDKLDPLQRITIWYAIEDQLDSLITNTYQLISLFKLPLNKLNYLQRDQIVRVIEDRSSVLFKNKADLVDLLALPLDKLTPWHRIKILRAIESQLSSLKTDNNALHTLLKYHLGSLQAAQPYRMFSAPKGQTENLSLAIEKQPDIRF